MRARFFALPLALAALFAAPVQATTVEPLDDAGLVSRSDLIARVTVVSARAERVGRRVLTFYELDVVEAWRSRDRDAGRAVPTRVTLALPGGRVDVDGRSLEQRVPGTPVLTVGRAYVLCLGDDVGPQNARGVVGLWQGAFEALDSGRLRAFVHGPGAAFVAAAALRARLGSPR